MQTKPLVLHVWCDGDRTVGCYGDEATVTLEYANDPPDPEYVQAAKELLENAFRTLWDAHRIYVETTTERDARIADENDEQDWDDPLDPYTSEGQR